MTDELTYDVVSTFAGIGGFDIGLEQVGMTTVAQVEIDRKCIAVLERRFPHVRRFGDIKGVRPEEIGRCDVLVGGFPCQDLSVAGRRAGLAGERSGLFFEFLRLADSLRPRWLVIENVPGLLSSASDPQGDGSDAGDDDPAAFHNGADFAVLLGELTGFTPEVPEGGWRSSGVCAGPKRTAAWRVLDSQYFGVAQRRRRVFVVCGPGAGGAVALLADAEGGRGHPPARGAPREGAAGTLGGGAPDARGHRNDLDTSGAYVADGVAHALRARHNLSHREDSESYVTGPVSGGDYGGGRDGSNDFPNLVGPHVDAFAWQQGSDGKDGQRGRSWVARAGDYAAGLSRSRHDAVAITPAEDLARPLTSSMRKHHDEDTDTLVAHTLKAEGADASEDGTGRGVPLVVPEAEAFEARVARNGRGAPEAIVPPLKAESGSTGKGDSAPLVFRKAKRAASDQDDETWVEGDVANTQNQFDGGDARATEIVVDSFAATGGGGGQMGGDLAQTLRSNPTNSQTETPAITTASAVRRLTPTECERLQGFPDGWTHTCDVEPYSIATCKCPDGPRYAMCGNAVTVNVIRYIGARIREVDEWMRSRA